MSDHRPLEFDALDDLPECCAGEGYPGIAHDLLTARRERDEALARLKAERKFLAQAIADGINHVTHERDVVTRERDEARQQVAEARAERDAAFEDLEAAEQQVAALREALERARDIALRGVGPDTSAETALATIANFIDLRLIRLAALPSAPDGAA